MMITNTHIARAVEGSRPSVTERDAVRLEGIYAKFRSGGGLDEEELRNGMKVSFA